MKLPDIFVCVLAAICGGVAQAAPPAKPLAPPRTEQSAVTPAIKDLPRHVQFLERLKEDSDIDLVFLGDSITDGWPRNGEATWVKFAPYKPANFGVSGDRTEHLLWRITNGELEGIHPKVAVIMIGTNDIGQVPADRPEWAAAGVKKVVDTVLEKLPETKILLLAVFPRGEKTDPKRGQVEQINAIISKLADGKKVQYLDISSAFLDADGNLSTDIMPDRLHPNAKGYRLWYNAMQPTLDGMMKN